MFPHFYFIVLLLASVSALECSYGVSEVKIGLAQPFFLLPPLCDHINAQFTCSSKLPEGIVFNSTYGGFNGVTNENGTVWGVTVVATYGTQRNDIRLTMTVGQFEDNQPGITVLYAESPSNSQMDPLFFEKIYSGQLSYVAYQSRQINMVCEEQEYSECPTALDMDITNMWNYWYSSFKSQDQEGWTFNMDVEDEYEFYIDNELCAVPENTVTKSLSEGIHHIQLKAINYDSTAKSYVTYKNTVNAEAAVVVSSEYFSSLPPVNQYLNWRTSDLILVKNHYQTLTAYYTGFLSWSTDKSLPEGMKIKQYGRISGTPTKVSELKEYKIIGKSYDNTFYNTTIYIQVLDDIKENMIQGLDGLYYASAERDCAYRKIDRTIDFLKFRRIDKNVNHLNDEIEQWEGLTSTFISSFTVDWTGLLNIEYPGDYIFYITANGGFRFEIEGTVVVESTLCSSVVTNEGRYSLKSGLVNIKLYYWKPAGDLKKSLKLEWYHLSIGRVVIPDSSFYHIPRYPISYDYETSTYIKGTEITPNCPTFVTITKNDYTNYKISPNLPAGLKFDTSTLCISGTITEEKESLKDTYFTLTAEPNVVSELAHPLSTRFTLSYESYLSPISITYQPINGKIGEAVSSIPTIVGNDFLVETRTELPVGLKLNSQTGEIYGYPAEAVTNKVVEIIVRNAAGQISGTVTITIADCAAGEFFFRLKYVTGSGTGLTVSVMSNGFSYYLNEEHEADKFYASYQCIASSKVTVKFSQASGRAGTYSIYQKNNYLLAYGEYNIGIPTILEVDLENIIGTPEIKYEPSSYSFVSGETVSFYPQILKYAVTEYSVVQDSNFPTGLSFNTSTGLISGEITSKKSSESGSFRIVAYNDEKPSEFATISYNISTTCEASDVMVTIKVSGGRSGPNMLLVVTDGKGNVIVKFSSVKLNEIRKYKKCFAEGSYNFQFGSLDGKSWDATSYIEIFNKETLTETLKFTGGSTTSLYKLLLMEPVPTNGKWSYSSNYQEDWKTAPTVSWEVEEGGKFPRPNATITMYYRYNFKIVDVGSYGRYEVKIITDTGFLMYMNGREIVRDKMPKGEVTSETRASSTKNLRTVTIISLPYDFVNGDNIIAVESHKGESEDYEEIDPFSVLLSLEIYSSKCANVVGKSTGPYPSVEAVSSTINDDLTCGECAQQLFDVDYNTKMCIYGYISDYNQLEIVSRLIDRYVAFNGYIFVTANDEVGRDPSAWKLYATTNFDNENIEWELIDEKREMKITDDRFATIPFTADHATTKLYNGFKIVFTETKQEWSSLIQLADYYPSICGVSMCLAEYPYPATNTGFTAKIPCSEGSSNYRTRLCKADATWDYENVTACVGMEGSFSYPTVEPLMVYDLISPIKPTINGLVVNIRVSEETPLPSSLTVDPVSGEITGIPREMITPAKTYSIIADSPSGEIRTNISLEIKTASCGDSGIYPNEFQKERCAIDESGYRTRECLPTSPPTWGKWDESKCTPGRAPRCNLTNSDLVFIFKEPITPVKPNCVYEYKTISFDKNLPTGLALNEKGEIAGTPLSPMKKSQYVMKIVTEDGGYDDITFFISVYGNIKSCRLPYSSIVIALNIEATFAEIICDELVDEFIAENLPPGFSIDSKTSVISGIATEEGEYVANITAINVLGSYSFSVTIKTADVKAFGITVGSAKESVYSYEINDYVERIVNRDGDFDYSSIDDSFSQINTNPPVNIGGIVRNDYFIYVFYGYVKIEVGGEYKFEVKTSFYYGPLYVDDMSSSVCSSSPCEYTATFEEGSVHRIAFMLYQSYSYSFTTIETNFKWQYGSMEVMEYIPSSVFFNTPSFLKEFYYPSNDFIFDVNQDIGKISPNIVGVYTNITGPANLPAGLSLVDGVLQGIPTAVVKRTGYTIVCSSETSVIEVKIYITVTAISKEYMIQGLIGKYYTSLHTVPCIFTDDPEEDASYTLSYERIIPTYHHEPSADIWEGLSNAFSSQFVAKWEGYLYIPETGVYSFILVAEDGVRLIVGDADIYTTSCGSSTASGSATLTEGTNPIKIIYWKTTNSAIKAVSIKWSKSAGNTVIPLQEIPLENLLYKPKSSLSYNYPISVYLVGKEIPKNSPIYNTIDSNSYKSFYCTPALPNGLFLDATNGDITGIPIQVTSTDSYTITVVGNDNDQLSYTIKITVDPYAPPRNLQYPEIKINLNEAVAVKPTLENGENVAFYTNDILPQGLKIDPFSGEISGTATAPFDNTITIYCTNPSGTTEAEVKIKVTGCESTKTYIEIDYAIGNKEVGFKVIDKDGKIVIEQASGSVDSFSSGELKFCMLVGSTTFVLNSTAKLGGTYSIYNNGNLIKYGAYKDGMDNIEFNFDSTISKPKILKYESNEDIHYSSIEYKFYPVLEGGALKFSIDEENWPFGFSLDENTGVITGRLSSSVDRVNCNVYATSLSGERSNTYTLTVVRTECMDSMVGAYVSAVEDGNNMIVEMKLDDRIVFSYSGLPATYSRTFTYCSSAKEATIRYGSIDSKKWNKDSVVSLLLVNSKVNILNHKEDGEIHTVTTRLVSFIVGSSKWQVTTNEPATSWIGEYLEPIPDGWSEYTLSTLPLRNKITTYYRTKFTFEDDISNVTSLQMYITFDAGIILYLNGVEFYRRNLPLTGVYNDYPAIKYFYPPTTKSISVAPHLLMQGDNILAIEVHKHDRSDYSDPLNLLLLPIMKERKEEGEEEEKCKIKTLPSYATPSMKAQLTGAYEKSPDYFRYSYDYDNISKLVTNVLPPDVDVNLYFYWPDGLVENFNEFVYITSQDVQRDPSRFDIYGTFDADTPEWILLGSYGRIVPDIIFNTVIINIDNIDRSYEGYRWHVREVKDTSAGWGHSLAVPEFLALQCEPVYCQSEMKNGIMWKSTIAGNRAYYDSCGSVDQYGFKERLCKNENGIGVFEDMVDYCGKKPTKIEYPKLLFYINEYANYTPTVDGGVDRFTIDCKLPHGVLFDTRYGMIKGAPDVKQEVKDTKCKVFGVYGDNFISTNITIETRYVVCRDENGAYPDTEGGKYAEAACATGYDGLRTIYCDNTDPIFPKFTNENTSACVLLKPIIRYKFETMDLHFSDKVEFEAEIIAAEYKVSSDSLPKDLTVDPDTGKISGTINESTDDKGKLVTIKIENPAGSSTAQFTLIIKDYPAELQYSFTSWIFNIGFNNQTSAVSINGTNVELLRMEPELPKSLNINLKNGIIYGIVDEGSKESSNTYQLVGRNSEGEVKSTPITLQVIQPKCLQNGTWKETNAGQNATGKCPIHYEGTVTRYCTKNVNPEWEDPVSVCVKKDLYCEDPENIWPKTEGGKNVTIVCGRGFIGNRTRECVMTDNDETYFGNEDRTGCEAVSPSIRYISGDMVFALDEECPKNIPQLNDLKPDSYLQIDPEMPLGMFFDNKTGEISGTPKRSQIRKPYIVAGYGLDNEVYITTIYIQITSDFATYILYNRPDMTFFIGLEDVSQEVPKRDGIIKKWYVVPALPKNLQIATDGKVYGTVESGTPLLTTKHTVYAEVELTNLTSQITITVKQPVCNGEVYKDITWPTTNGNETAVGECPVNFEGSPTRFCPISATGEWSSEIIGECVSKAPSFEYPSSTYNFIVNTMMANIEPINVKNSPKTYLLSCDNSILLYGIQFDENTGIFSGTPNDVFTSRCSVYAKNDFGNSKDFTLFIKVTKPQCKGENGWKDTDVHSFAVLPCETDYGVMYRECLELNTTHGKWSNQIDKSQCVNKPVDPENDFDKYVSLTLDINGVTNSIDDNAELEIKQAVSKTLNIPVSNIYIKIISRRRIRRFMRSLQASTKIQVFIKTDEPEKVSSVLETEVIQKEIVNELKQSTKTDIFKNSDISMAVEAVDKDSNSDSKGSNAGTIVGIIFGVIILIVVIVLAFIYFVRTSNAGRLRVKSRSRTLTQPMNRRASIAKNEDDSKQVGVVHM